MITLLSWLRRYQGPSTLCMESQALLQTEQTFGGRCIGSGRMFRFEVLLFCCQGAGKEYGLGAGSVQHF